MSKRAAMAASAAGSSSSSSRSSRRSRQRRRRDGRLRGTAAVFCQPAVRRLALRRLLTSHVTLPAGGGVPCRRHTPRRGRMQGFAPAPLGVAAAKTSGNVLCQRALLCPPRLTAKPPRGSITEHIATPRHVCRRVSPSKTMRVPQAANRAGTHRSCVPTRQRRVRCNSGSAATQEARLQDSAWPGVKEGCARLINCQFEHPLLALHAWRRQATAPQQAPACGA